MAIRCCASRTTSARSATPAQSTPFGELDAEADALHRVEEHTGVPLTEDERNSE